MKDFIITASNSDDVNCNTCRYSYLDSGATGSYKMFCNNEDVYIVYVNHNIVCNKYLADD